MQKIIITEANSNTLFLSMKNFSALFGTTTVGQLNNNGEFYLSTNDGQVRFVAKDLAGLDAFMHGAIAAARKFAPKEDIKVINEKAGENVG